MADMSLKDLSGALGQMANNSPKIQKDVELIRIALCGKGGILEAMTKMSEEMDTMKKDKELGNLKKGMANRDNNNQKKLLTSTNNMSITLGKILDTLKKNSGDKSGTRGLSGANFKRNDRSIKEKTDKLGTISKAIDIIEKLKSLTLKDLLFAKIKIKDLFNVMKKSLKIFRMFENNKEAENTISFMNTAIPIVNKLAKIGAVGKLAKAGGRVVEIIFTGKDGKGGIIKMFKILNEHKKDINQAKKNSKSIAVASGSLFLTALMMTGVAALGPTSLVGALISAGIVVILLGTFKLMGNATGSIIKGSLAFLLMGVGLLAFSFGFGILRQATEGLSLEEAGIMAASVVGTGLAVAGVGFLLAPIALGSIALLMIGTSIGILSMSLKSWVGFDAQEPTDNIKYAISGLKEALGMDSNQNESTGGKLSGAIGSAGDFIGSLFQFGKIFFQMASLLVATIVLSIITLTLRAWDNYNPSKAIGNIKTGITGMKEALGINDRENESLGGKLGGAVTDVVDVIGSVLQFGKVFAQMASLLIGTIVLAIVNLTLRAWDNYDPSKAIGNIKTGITGMKEALGIDDRNNETFVNKLGGVFTDIVDVASSVLQMGKVFIQMGTLLVGTIVLAIIRLSLSVWDNYNPKNALNNISKSVSSLKSTLGMSDHTGGEEGGFGSLLSQIGGGFSDYLSLGTSLLQMGKVFIQMGTLLVAMGILTIIKQGLDKWAKFNPSNSLKNIKKTIAGLKKILGMEEPKQKKKETEDNSIWGRIKSTVSNGVSAVGNAVNAAIDTVSSYYQTVSAIVSFGPKFVKLGEMLLATGTMYGIYKSIKPWESIKPSKIISNIKEVMSGLNEILSDKKIKTNNAGYNILYKKSKTLMDLFKTLHDNEIEESLSSIPLKGSVKAVNALDISKAHVLMDLFKTIGLIKDKRPFEQFDNAVDKFVEGCNSIVDSMGKVVNPEAHGESNIFGFKDNNKKSNNQPSEVSGGVNITNTQQLAEAIAKALRNLSVRINPNMIDVNLVAETGSGKTVKLTLRE